MDVGIFNLIDLEPFTAQTIYSIGISIGQSLDSFYMNRFVILYEWICHFNICCIHRLIYFFIILWSHGEKHQLVDRKCRCSCGIIVSETQWGKDLLLLCRVSQRRKTWNMDLVDSYVSKCTHWQQHGHLCNENAGISLCLGPIASGS